MSSSSPQENELPHVLVEEQFIPLPDGLEGWDLLSSSTDGDGQPTLIASQFEEPQPELPRGNWEFWNGWRDQRKRFRVCRWNGTGWEQFEVPLTCENYSIAKSLPGGEWLLVWRWSERKETGQNAHIYVSGTGVVRTFDLHPGFNHVEATPGGTVWIGYDDDTVEHFGMGNEIATPPWDSGLVALNPVGEILFDFDRLGVGPNAPLPFSDCYALNVVDDREVWVYYWRQFSLLRLVDHQIQWRWDTIPVRFAAAFAVATGDEAWETVLLAAIPSRHSLLYRLNFCSHRVEEFHPVRASGERIYYQQAFGRGNRLYLRHPKGFSMFSVEANY